ncbi:MAG: hypothetical protein A2045_04320 [Rhodocyclales bacterium GWA2_65_20]|nr:MAG: hypothetical protein A2045_04320 [Rhodocyclales bacterium GWA2_65_20]
MNVPTLEEVLGKVRQIPSLSIVVTELLASMDKENVETAYLVGKIGQDQGLAARVLRVANSAFYGLTSRVSAVNEAVTVLGFNAVRSLALAAGVVQLFPHAAGNKFDRIAFWQHAIGTGVCARMLAARLGKDPETAFSAGLLHDMGKLVLHVYFPDTFDAVLARCAADGCAIVEAERAVLGFDHAAIGYEVARQWRFPPSIQQAIRNHHRPDADPAFMSDVVHVANVLCDALDIGNGGDDVVAPLSAAAWGRLGLDWAALPACLRDIGRLNASMNLLTAE